MGIPVIVVEVPAELPAGCTPINRETPIPPFVIPRRKLIKLLVDPDLCIHNEAVICRSCSKDHRVIIDLFGYDAPGAK